MGWYLQALKKYVDFAGRARRKEYWFFVLFNIIISVALTAVDMMIGTYGILSGLYGLAVILPSIALGIRRLHDINKSGWWILIAFVPFIGVLVLLVFAVMPGTAGDNDYGADPKAA